MITFGMLERVYLVQCSGEPGRTGTAFTIEVDTREYLVTARHNIEPSHRPHALTLWLRDAWHSIDIVGEVWTPNYADIDVSVLALSERLTRTRPALVTSTAGTALGQDTFFLGFPWSLKTGHAIAGRPVPFVKKATLSASLRDDAGLSILWLDGHVNSGFSGGPVICLPLSPSPDAPFIIAGVVVDYVTDVEASYQDGDDRLISVETNGGFIRAHDIAHAVNGARALGTGALIT